MNGNFVLVAGILLIALGTYLTYYGQELKNRKLKEEMLKWDNKISIKLLGKLFQSMNTLSETIKEYSSAKVKANNIGSFRILCKGCDLNRRIKILKSTRNNDYFTLREYLFFTWQNIVNEINEIKSASNYIPRESYFLFLKISERGNSLYHLSNSPNNFDLEPWGDALFDLNNLAEELGGIIKTIESPIQ